MKIKELLAMPDGSSLGFLIDAENSGDYYTLTAKAIEITAKREVRGLSTHALDEFAITGQGNNRDREKRYIYCWDCVYLNAYHVRLWRCETMRAILHHVDRGLARLAERFTSPRDFSEYVGRVADVLGADSIVTRPANHRTEGFKIEPRQRGIETLRHMIEEWAKPQDDEAAA